MVKKDLTEFEITNTLEEISQIKKESFKQIVRKACDKKAFKYLMAKKESHSKGNNLEYQKLEMQDYFLTLNPSLAKFYSFIS